MPERSWRARGLNSARTNSMHSSGVWRFALQDRERAWERALPVSLWRGLLKVEPDRHGFSVVVLARSGRSSASSAPNAMPSCRHWEARIRCATSSNLDSSRGRLPGPARCDPSSLCREADVRLGRSGDVVTRLGGARENLRDSIIRGPLTSRTSSFPDRNLCVRHLPSALSPFL
jgi:hypothetical protein